MTNWLCLKLWAAIIDIDIQKQRDLSGPRTGAMIGFDKTFSSKLLEAAGFIEPDLCFGPKGSELAGWSGRPEIRQRHAPCCPAHPDIHCKYTPQALLPKSCMLPVTSFPRIMCCAFPSRLVRSKSTHCRTYLLQPGTVYYTIPVHQAQSLNDKQDASKSLRSRWISEISCDNSV